MRARDGGTSQTRDLAIGRRQQLQAAACGGASAGRRNWLSELLPLAITLGLVWLKLVYASAFLRSGEWSNTASSGQGMPPSGNMLGIVVAYAQIATGTMACLLLIGGLLLLLSRGWRLLGLVGLNVGLTALAVANLLHTRFYGDVLSAGSFTTPRMVKDIMPSIVDLARTLDPVYGIDLLAAVVIVPAFLWKTRRLGGLPRSRRAQLAGGLMLAGLLLALPTLNSRWQRSDTVFSPTSPRIEAAAVVGLLPYHVLEIVTPRTTAAEPPAVQVERVRRFLAQERLRKGQPSPLFGLARGANVMVISMESLQTFPMGLIVDGQPIMPNLTAFARESLSFPNYHEQTYLGTTSDAQFGVLQSLHPRPVGFMAMDYATNTFRALPSVLTERGYETFSAVAAPGDFWNAEKLNPRYGFHSSFYEDTFDPNDFLGAWLSDDQFFSQMVPRLEGRPEPFFAYMQTSSHHHPYKLPHHYQHLQLGRYQGTLLGDYLQSAHLFDRAFGQFVERLRGSGMLDRTMIVLYGDHQGFLGDPHELGELLGRPQWCEYDRFSVRKRTPLVIRLPGGAHAGERPVVGGHLDVAPTVLSLLGIDIDDGDYEVMLGRDLTRERPSLVVFRDGGFADDTHYYIQRFGTEDGPVCLEIATGRPVDCTTLEDQRRAARERLEISDLIVQGDLIPRLLENRRQAQGGREEP
jgi:lipoteichoic acid synthase